jgi:hypothetical protein
MRRRTLKNGLAALRRILVAPVAVVSESDPSSFFQVGGSAPAGLSDSVRNWVYRKEDSEGCGGFVMSWKGWFWKGNIDHLTRNSVTIE